MPDPHQRQADNLAMVGNNVEQTMHAIQAATGVFSNCTAQLSKEMQVALGEATKAINEASRQSTELGKKVFWLTVVIAGGTLMLAIVGVANLFT